MVVPRFGEDLVGGAELHARWLCERLADEGHEVEVLTTCAVDHRSWRNVLPAGTERMGKLVIHRFPCDERDLGIHGELERAIVLGLPVSRDEELLWLRNGVSSTALERELAGSAADRYDVVLAMPYLFGTTYFAYRARRDRTVVIPCLHDEPYARLGFVREMLEGARGVMFNSDAEAYLGLSLAPGLRRWAVVGVGFDLPERVQDGGFARTHGLREPFLLYVGRREGGKNTPLLIDYFLRYVSRRPGDGFQLVMVGAGDAIPRHQQIIDLKIQWTERDALLACGAIFCQPSTNESLSIVLMQAWLAGLPAVVHGDCAVTREHCRRSNGGLWFTSYAEFEEIVDKLRADRDLRRRLGASGRKYVLQIYSWEAVLARFHEALFRWVGEREQVVEG